MEAIRGSADIHQMPFVINGLLAIALRRQHKDIMKHLLFVRTSTEASSQIMYLPDELYQIESLVQLLLEDDDNERVYVELLDNAIGIHALLRMHSNRSGAHHAEMSKLYRALNLDIGRAAADNALKTVLSGDLVVNFGADTKFASLLRYKMLC